MRVRLDVTGDREMVRDLLRLGPAGEKVGKRVLKDVSEKVAKLAQADAPVDEVDGGQLQATVRATRPTKTSGGILSAGVLAGGPPLRSERRGFIYAVIQHEDVTLKHTRGRAKFVEIHVYAVAPTIPDLVRQGLDEEVRRAG